MIPLAVVLAALLVPVTAALLQGAGFVTVLKLAALWPVSAMGAVLIAPVLVPPGLVGWMVAFALGRLAGLAELARASVAGLVAGLCAPVVLVRDQGLALPDYLAVALPCALSGALAALILYRRDGPFAKR